MELLKALAIGAMFGIGIFQMLRRNMIRSAIGLIIISNVVNLFLLSTGEVPGRGRCVCQHDRPTQRRVAPGTGADRDRDQHGGLLAGAGAAVRALGVSYRTADSDGITELKH